MIHESFLEDSPIASSQHQECNKTEVIKERSIAGLLARLKTYASLPWSVKPLEVSPLVCARHGWLSREPDALICAVCGASVSARLPPVQTAENYAQLLVDMVCSLARSHLDDCPWQSDPMPDDTPLLPFTDPEADLQAFLNISESLAPISASVNANVRFSIQCPVVRDLTEFVLNRGSDRLLSLQDDIRLRCCLLTIAGWEIIADAPPSAAVATFAVDAASGSKQQQQPPPPRTLLLCCCFCQRRVGLWSLNRASSNGSGAYPPVSRICCGSTSGDQQPATTAAVTSATVAIDDASLSDGIEAGMSLGGGGGGSGGGNGNMAAPSYALTEMMFNRQLLFAKRQHSVSDWSLISNAGSEAASTRDLEDVQSVAGSTISNVSAGELASQLQEFEQQQAALSMINLPASQSAVVATSDPDNWSTVTNPDSDARSVAAQSEDVASFSGVGCMDDSIGGGGKRPRLDTGDDTSSVASAASSSAPAAVVIVDLLTLHWPWCPWRPGDPSEDWCRSVLSHPDLRPPAATMAEATNCGGGGGSGSGPLTPTPTHTPTSCQSAASPFTAA